MSPELTALVGYCARLAGFPGINNRTHPNECPVFLRSAVYLLSERRPYAITAYGRLSSCGSELLLLSLAEVRTQSR